MYTLFIDTHFKDVQLVIYKNEKILQIAKIENCDRTSKNVLPLLKKTFQENNISYNQIEKIIVCNGPGSFTGIRISITIAKVMAYCLNIPIYTISYVKSKELLENEVIVDNINYQKIPTYNYLKLTDCFNANPLYVKTIEALNDKKNAS